MDDLKRTDEREVALSPSVAYEGELNNLQPGRTYQVDIIAPATGVLSSAIIAPERSIPQSARGHMVDGAFTSVIEEWSDIVPIRGRYAHLYADFDGTCLHILNDWHICKEPINEWDYNKFEIRTWPENDQEQTLVWIIRVYPNGRVNVLLNDEFVDDLVDGTHGHGRSPLLPDKDHSIYELSVDVDAAHRRHGHTKPAEAWRWEMTWLDPLVASPNSRMADLVVAYQPPILVDGRPGDPCPTDDKIGLAQEPVHVSGKLLAAGGMTITAHWCPPTPPEDSDAAHVWIRCLADTAEVYVSTVPGQGEQDITCRLTQLPELSPAGRCPVEADALGSVEPHSGELVGGPYREGTDVLETVDDSTMMPVEDDNPHWNDDYHQPLEDEGRLLL